MTEYIFNKTIGAPGAPLVFTFHGTGGDETQLHGFGLELLPGAHVISPRGDVSENGQNRYFRRTGEGVYDMNDLAQRTATMADFLRGEAEALERKSVIGLGYSNGANILASVSFSAPEIVDDLVLMHPLIPFAPAPQPGLSGRRVLITAGRRDPISPAVQTDALAMWYEQQGAEVTIHWHPGGHEISKSEFEAVSDFLGAHGKSSAA